MVGALAALILIGTASTAAVAQSQAAAPKAPPLTDNLQQRTNWCSEYRLGQLTTEARIAEPNRTRLLAAQDVLAPGFQTKRSDGIRLLADYQVAMEARRPDRVLAATYLALASAVPIDVALVERVNSLLCVCASEAVAKGVAVIANAEWEEMNGVE